MQGTSEGAAALGGRLRGEGWLVVGREGSRNKIEFLSVWVEMRV